MLRNRRKSNSGHRKLKVEDRILLFLMRMRRKVPFEGLQFEFGVAASTASNYYYDVLKMFHAEVVPRLLHPLKGPEIEAMTPEDFARDLPGCKVIFDLTGFRKSGKENVLLSRLLWSAYHHQSEVGVLFGTYYGGSRAKMGISFRFYRCHAEWFIYFSI